MARRTDSSPMYTIVSGVITTLTGLFCYVGGLLYTDTGLTGLGAIGRSAAEDMWSMTRTIAAFIAALGIGFIIVGVSSYKKERVTLERVRGLTAEGGVSPREFLDARDALRRKGDFTGIYVLHNKTKDMYYVGQSTRVVGRLCQHLTGHGNGDVYADYKYGDDFEVNVVTLRESGYDSLDALERDTIKTYDAYNRGYNRTRGNKN